MPGYPRGWDAERIQRIAHDLHEVAGKPNDDGTVSRWLHGPKYTDIFADLAPGGRLIRVEVSFGGYYLLWDGHALRTGLTDEMDIDAFGAPKSRFIREHPTPDLSIVHAASRLVSHIADQNLSQVILAVLPQPPNGASK